MGFFSKEIYEKKQMWRENHNKKQWEKITPLSEEDHEWIQDLHSLRHKFHCSSLGETSPEHDDLYEHLDNFSSQTLPKPPTITPPEDWHTDDTLFYYEDSEFFIGEKEGKEKEENYGSAMDFFDEEKNRINDLLREYIKKINEKFGLNY